MILLTASNASQDHDDFIICFIRLYVSYLGQSMSMEDLHNAIESDIRQHDELILNDIRQHDQLILIIIGMACLTIGITCIMAVFFSSIFLFLYRSLPSLTNASSLRPSHVLDNTEVSIQCATTPKYGARYEGFGTVSSV